MSNVVCDTGMRPTDLHCGYEKLHPWKISKVDEILSYLTEKSPSTVISGGRTGLDQYLAWAAFNLNIPLIFYLPFEGWDTKWNTDQRNQLKKFMSQPQHV